MTNLKLKILMPTEVLLEKEVGKVTVEGRNGSFCLLPRHVDTVSILEPGILSFVDQNSHEEFVAVDGGILVKCASQILVSTRNAVRGPELGSLKQTVEQNFRVLDEREKSTRSALARLEANIIRRFIELQEIGG